MKIGIFAALSLASTFVAGSATAQPAPFTMDVILPLSGPGAFVGKAVLNPEIGPAALDAYRKAASAGEQVALLDGVRLRWDLLADAARGFGKPVVPDTVTVAPGLVTSLSSRCVLPAGVSTTFPPTCVS